MQSPKKLDQWRLVNRAGTLKSVGSSHMNTMDFTLWYKVFLHVYISNKTS